jgi:hypothetical protein
MDFSMYSYGGQNPVRLLDPNGLWAISAEAYAILGVGVEFGQSKNGDYFIALKGGVGIGGGFGFDLAANQPGYDKNGGRFQTAGTQYEGSINLGPVQVAGFDNESGTKIINPTADEYEKYDNGGPYAEQPQDKIEKFKSDSQIPKNLGDFLKGLKIDLNNLLDFKVHAGASLTGEVSTTLCGESKGPEQPNDK